MLINPIVKNAGEKIRIVCVPVKDFKTAQITVSLLVPRTQNLAENIVLSNYLVHSSKKYPTMASLNAKLESLYGTSLCGGIVRHGESSRVELTATCIDNKFALDGEDLGARCLELLTELLFEPNVNGGSLDESLFELERRLAIENIESEVNDKRSYALTRMVEVMCADEVYGISKDEILSDLRKITAQSTYNAWQELLMTATVQVNLVGNLDADIAKDIIEKRFSTVDRAPADNSTLFVEAADDVTEETEEMEINQSKLVIGFRSGMKDKNDNFYAAKVMTDVFGGGPYSRLFMNVREKLSLCYYCSARLLREKGILVIQSGIEKQNKQKVIDEINRQLDVMKSGEFEQKDFIASKTAICDSLRTVADTPDGIDAFLSMHINEDILPIEEMIENYENVTSEQITEAAQKLSLDTIFMLSGKESE